MKRFRIDVGYMHGAKPGNIVGAIANEADLSSKNIGAIDINESFTLVDLPESLSNKAKETLQKTRVAGQRLNIREWSDEPPKKRKKK
jgi:ATP-dependent RNA helicase DeaD